MNSDSKSSTFPTSSTTGSSSGGLGGSGGSSSSSGLSGSSSGLSGSSSGVSGSGTGSSGILSSSGGSMSSGGGSMSSSGGLESEGTVKRVAQTAHQYVDKLEQTLGSSGAKVMSMQEEYGEMAREQVKANPLAAVGIAFVVGIVFSKLFMR